MVVKDIVTRNRRQVSPFEGCKLAAMTTLLRLAGAADAEQISAIYAPIVRETVISFETDPPDAAELRHRIATTLRTHPWLVCERSGEVLGYAYGSRHRDRSAYRWAVDVSAYVRADARRRGLARRLYRALLELLTLQGYCVAYAGITLPNPASVGLHEALSFELLGVYHRVGYKFGAWHDVGWWERSLQSREGVPAEPKRPDELAGEAAWRAVFEQG